jgi:tRNA U34 5-methylaminomethyl-2-thiouridine-forming methyltransferase MnmC
MHVFINQGFFQVRESPVHVLEIGFGTGLNMLLTLKASRKPGIDVYYHAIEKYPLLPSEYEKLNYERLITGIPTGSLKRIHQAPWDVEFDLTGHFRIFKERADIRSLDLKNKFDLVYFDAFAPDKQPELWSLEIFSSIFEQLNRGAVLVTYAAKGDVRRKLLSCGFHVEKVPGPPGKREMLRACRI